MKKILFVLLVLVSIFHTTPVYAASKKPVRLQILSDKAAIELTYKKSIEQSKLEFTHTIQATKSLKGKEKSAAIKAATAKQIKATSAAKDLRKKQLKDLSTKK